MASECIEEAKIEAHFIDGVDGKLVHAEKKEGLRTAIIVYLLCTDVGEFESRGKLESIIFVDIEPFEFVDKSKGHCKTSQMCDLLDIVDCYCGGLPTLCLHSLLLQVPKVQSVGIGGDPFVQEGQVVDAVSNDPPYQFFSLELVAVVPKGHTQTVNNASNALLSLTECHRHDSHTFIV